MRLPDSGEGRPFGNSDDDFLEEMNSQLGNGSDPISVLLDERRLTLKNLNYDTRTQTMDPGRMDVLIGYLSEEVPGLERLLQDEDSSLVNTLRSLSDDPRVDPEKLRNWLKLLEDNDDDDGIREIVD